MFMCKDTVQKAVCEWLHDRIHCHTQEEDMDSEEAGDQPEDLSTEAEEEEEAHRK